MRYRWILICVHRETGDPFVKTVIAESEQEAFARVADDGLLVERIVKCEPLSALPVGVLATSTPGASPEPPSLLVDALLPLGWLVLGIGGLLYLIAYAMSASAESQAEVLASVRLATIGSVAFSVGVFTVVISAAAKSICSCLLRLEPAIAKGQSAPAQ